MIEDKSRFYLITRRGIIRAYVYICIKTDKQHESNTGGAVAAAAAAAILPAAALISAAAADLKRKQQQLLLFLIIEVLITSLIALHACAAGALIREGP